jgi:hypothetical protein
VSGQQGLKARAQGGIAGADGLKKGGAFGRGFLDGHREQGGLAFLG